MISSEDTASNAAAEVVNASSDHVRASPVQELPHVALRMPERSMSTLKDQFPDQTDPAEVKLALNPPDVNNAWTSIGKLVQEYNDGSLARTTEDLNTLLVFVGLFSAAVSTLLSVSTPFLQESPADVTARTLVLISQQLCNLSAQTNPLQVNIAGTNAVQSSSFNPSTIPVMVNVLWISCLATSLMISFGIILLKAILRLAAYDHRLSGISQPRPKEFRVRYFRVLEQSTSFRLALGLPILLMFSLTAFLVGLLLFTIQMNHTVAGFTVLLVELPIWLWIIHRVSPLFRVFVEHIQHAIKAQDPRFLTPSAAEEQQRKWDISVLVATERFVGQDDGTHLELTRQCLAKASADDVYSYVRQILPERASHPWLRISSLDKLPPPIFRELSDESLTASAKIVGDAVERLLTNYDNNVVWSEKFQEGISFLAQIDPLRALPNIPILFGKLFSVSKDFAIEVVSTLQGFGWKVQPTIATSEALSNLIQAVNHNIRSDRVPPSFELYHWMLATLSEVDSSILQDRAPQIKYLLSIVHPISKEQSGVIRPAVSSQLLEKISRSAASLKHKCPGVRFIDEEALSSAIALTQNFLHTKNLEEANAKMSWREKLDRVIQAISRSRRRQDLMH